MCVCVFERFDSELSAAQDEVQRERSLREKLAREKDVLTGEVFGLRQQLEVCVSVVYTVARCFREGGFSFLGTWCVICELFSVRYPSILNLNFQHPIHI